MKKITVSAPGKLMLLGEHAVVYGKPCLVTAVNQRMTATVELTDDKIFQLDAPDVQITNYQKPITHLGKGEIPKGAKFVEMTVKNFLNRHPERLAKDLSRMRPSNKLRDSSASPQNDNLGIKIVTKSEFSSEFGFGSSSASTVCVIKALSQLTGANLDNKQIFNLAYKTVLDIQGKGSGFDVAAAIYGGTLYFVSPGKVIQPLKINTLPLIVGYSGIKFDTVRIIDEVAQKAKKYPWVIGNVYDQIGQLVEQAKKAILKEDWESLGELMNFNEGYLATLGVEGKKLSRMIYAARDGGAYGAKLSGAGVGDCMIALHSVQGKQAIKKAITEAGGQVINIKTNAEGVRIE
ncbi:MAG: mevalonate kinase [Microgenomates group bacterium Gr01-1014_7]|nr:MAG: mevalonate kinase [Microgenomates group bacterium Gr01-1014_7]